MFFPIDGFFLLKAHEKHRADIGRETLHVSKAYGSNHIFMWCLWLMIFKHNNLDPLIIGMAVMIFSVNIFMCFSNRIFE